MKSLKGQGDFMSVSIYCPHCHIHTALSIALTPNGDEAVWDAGALEGTWWIGLCNNCNQPSLVWEDGRVIYPNPLPPPTDPLIPWEIALDMFEAKTCLNTKCFCACAVMARRALESACRLKGINGGNLVNKIQELTKLGIISKDIEEWATLIRWIGNDAAHSSNGPVRKEDAEDCLKLVEKFLDVLFVAPAIAKTRRESRSK